ncbi:TetR/AcrR family transcriptional regulator [Pelagibacterium luteolum]|nr:TetR/AcrR family transcriptional regulator [Pelagibacterium luteolum]
MQLTDLQPPPGRRERKRRQMLDQIAGMAFELFEREGYQNVTMEQIATTADVAKGTLYNHFQVKEAVLTHWIEKELSTDLAGLAPVLGETNSIQAQLTALFAASAQWCEGHRQYLPPYIRYRFGSFDAADGAVKDGEDLITTMTQLIATAQREDEVRSDLDAAHLAFLLNYLYLAALMRWLSVPELSLADEFEAAIQLFINGAAEPSA